MDPTESQHPTCVHRNQGETMSVTAATHPWLKMAENNAWANLTLYSTVTALPKQAFTARRPGFFPSVCQTLNHIYEVDLYYLP